MRRIIECSGIALGVLLAGCSGGKASFQGSRQASVSVVTEVVIRAADPDIKDESMNATAGQEVFVFQGAELRSRTPCATTGMQNVPLRGAVAPNNKKRLFYGKTKSSKEWGTRPGVPGGPTATCLVCATTLDPKNFEPCCPRRAQSASRGPAQSR